MKSRKGKYVQGARSKELQKLKAFVTVDGYITGSSLADWSSLWFRFVLAGLVFCGSGSSLTGSSLTGLVFDRFVSDRSVFGGIGLCGSGSSLRDWSLCGFRSVLTGSSLTGSSLTGSSLTGSSLTGSSLTGSSLTGSSLTGSSLAGLVFVVQVRLWRDWSFVVQVRL